MSQSPALDGREGVIAYFTMEVALDSSMPTYSGGLGVLAGDTLRAAADLGLPMVGISLVHRKGYFRQHLDEAGRQRESPDEWSPEERLEPVPEMVTISLEGAHVRLRAWRYLVRGVRNRRAPVYLLDADLPENGPEHRRLTDHLYGGDERYRLAQEAVLGLGGVALLEALGYRRPRAYHLNEGHSALLALGLLEGVEPTGRAVAEVRRHCVFTTHTPVPAGHDRFPMALVTEILGENRAGQIGALDCCLDGTLNMTYLALLFSRFVNGVAMRHGQISRGMFPQYPIASITNGVHAPTWTSAAFQELFDRHVPEWRQQTAYLRYAVSIPLDEVREAHGHAKSRLVAEVRRRSGVALDPEVMTLGFARRMTPYKRAALLVSDPDRLRAIAERTPLQIVFAGKAHPRDTAGKEMIHTIFEHAAELQGVVPIVFLENYDMDLARDLCAGADLWVNTPQQPQEASGTSGMKAALNGVPSLSVLDGWWIEGHVEGVTGWSIGESWEAEADPIAETAALYEKLARVAATFYERPLAFAAVMRNAVALNGSFFNAQRMLQQYALSAYRLDPAGVL